MKLCKEEEGKFTVISIPYSILSFCAVDNTMLTYYCAHYYIILYMYSDRYDDRDNRRYDDRDRGRDRYDDRDRYVTYIY